MISFQQNDNRQKLYMWHPSNCGWWWRHLVDWLYSTWKIIWFKKKTTLLLFQMRVNWALLFISCCCLQMLFVCSSLARESMHGSLGGILCLTVHSFSFPSLSYPSFCMLLAVFTPLTLHPHMLLGFLTPLTLHPQSHIARFPHPTYPAHPLTCC